MRNHLRKGDIMADFRFIHASDLHLGRRFAAMPEEIRPHLAEARHGAIPRLAGAARAAGAAHVLIAGDLFDTPTPSPRVLVQARPWVLLDEPFAALGPALRVEMLDLVQDLARETGAGLIMVTHAPEDVRRIADEVIFVEGGRAHAPAALASRSR